MRVPAAEWPKKTARHRTFPGGHHDPTAGSSSSLQAPRVKVCSCPRRYGDAVGRIAVQQRLGRVAETDFIDLTDHDRMGAKGEHRDLAAEKAGLGIPQEIDSVRRPIPSTHRKPRLR